MRVLRVHRRLTSWFVLLAVLASTLVPSWSHALGLAQGASWVEVCTAKGSRWVQADDGGAGSVPSLAHAAEHCPYCSVHTPALGLPPAVTAELPVSALSQTVPRAFLAAPRTLPAWASAQPRAPPLFS
jgi:hypothetical protein